MSGQTITEKILARRSGRSRVSPGETAWVEADVLMTHDVCGPPTIAILRQELGAAARPWDPDRVVLAPDHYVHSADENAVRNVEQVRAFAREQGIAGFYDPGTPSYRGVCHVALAEAGHTRPGEVLFGTDSHTCTAGAFGLFATGVGNTDAAFVMGTGKLWLRVPETIRILYDGAPPPYLTAKDMILALIGRIGVDGATYAALELGGEAVTGLSVESRMTLCNMAIECGAKSGIVAPDEVTTVFVAARTDVPFEPLLGDPGAPVRETLRFDVSQLEPQVARPSSPGNVVPVGEVAGTAVNRCYIGSCTGGKTEDLAAAARILAGGRVAVPTVCVPATEEVRGSLDRLEHGGRSLRRIYGDAGVEIVPPSCGACLGGPPDTPGRLVGDEVCISTTNRNFPGRMGSPRSSVYLASPYTVAASALAGKIADPRDRL